MTTEKKVGMGIAGQPTGGPPNVADVFSTYVYTGTGAARNIVNGIDLAGEGGLVWGKQRGFSVSNALFDTERVLDKRLSSNSTGAEVTRSGTISSFNSDGYSTGTGIDLNESGRDIISWTFRKAPKFFDIVTYTGSGSAKTISHNLESAPAMIMVKRIDSASGWYVFHKNTSQPHNKYLFLDTTAAESNYDNLWGPNAYLPTDTEFKVGEPNNVSGGTYVAYLFADNSAEDADDQMIKCGSYTGDGTTDGSHGITLGWEPQYLMFKVASGNTGEWQVYDTMRGIATGGDNALLRPNTSQAENPTVSFIDVTPTGFKLRSGWDGINASGATYIYMAIRAPMMKEPESATEVFTPFQVPNPTSTGTVTPHVVDMGFIADRSGSDKFHIGSRLTGPERLNTTSTAAGSTNSNQIWDRMNGYWNSAINGYMSWNFKRAKGFFDVVAYSGTGVAGRTVAHSLGVVPEMIWIRKRNGTDDWYTYHKDYNAGVTPEQYIQWLNQTGAAVGPLGSIIYTTAPTDTQLALSAGSGVNGSSFAYMAYLFASLAGVSKVGSYTGNGSSQTINCGFSAGSRFILIKRTDASGDWYIWDTTRGIVAGNDPHLSLNTTVAEVTTDDSIDPDSSGFIVNQVAATNINVSSGTYIFYAIA